MNAKGAPVAVWSNGADKSSIPALPSTVRRYTVRHSQARSSSEGCTRSKKTLLQLKRDFNFKKIIQDLEELVLANSGKDEFNEIFKLIFAKIWDEKEAQENRKNKNRRVSQSS